MELRDVQIQLCWVFFVPSVVTTASLHVKILQTGVQAVVLVL